MRGSQTVSAHSLERERETSAVHPLEFFLLVVSLMVFSEGILPRLLSSDATSDGSALLRYLWLPIYALAFAGIVWKARVVLQASIRLPFLMALLVLCAVSFTWSIDAGLTQRRSFAIIMTTAAGLFLGTRYSWKTMLRALAMVWLILALSSALTGLLVPDFGRDQTVHIGAWQGLFFEKNQLGGMMARAATVAAFLVLMDRKFRSVWMGLLIVCTLLVVLSTSITAILGLVIGLGAIGICALMKRGLATGLVTLWIGGLAAGVGIFVLVLVPDIVFESLGRDMTLTGRTDIWITLIDYIQERPVLGYGYGAFWADGSDPGNWVRETLQWDAPTAHNSWIEVTLALGFVGLGLLLADFVITVARALLSSVNTWVGVFALAFLAQFFLFSLSESASLQQNSIVWLIYVAIAAKLARRPKGIALIKPARSLPARRLGEPVSL
ncbi:MAG: O-antigen ligase [Pseudomonadota bacterium]